MKKLIFIGILFFLPLFVGAQNSNEPLMCTKEYAPVCGTVEVQCIKAPCNPVKQTFGNACMARGLNAKDITSGACETSSASIVGNDTDEHGCKGSAGYSWNQDLKQCVRPWEVKEKKMTPKQALMSGTWILMSYNNTPVTESGTMSFTKNGFNAKICNNMNGAYSIIGNRLIFRKVISTLMYCEGILSEIENKLNTPGLKFMVGSDTLTITTKSRDTITWKKQ